MPSPLVPDFPGFRPTVAKIDLPALARNARAIMRHTGTRLMGVVKADAYGHGALPCAKTLQEAGADYLAVALAEEALDLRAAGIDAPILVMGRVTPPAMGELARHGVTCALTCADDAAALQAAARETGFPAKAHVKIDTGMGRLGIQPEETDAFWDLLESCPLLDVEGMFTHFASADDEDQQFTLNQIRAFFDAATLLGNRRRRPKLLHCCASAGVHNAPQAYYDLVRPGLCLYGGTAPHCTAFTTEPVMQLCSRLDGIRTRPIGCAVSYGRTYVCPSERRIAVVPVGYADGVPRSLSNRGQVLVSGYRAPIVGQVCMDMLMLDVTDVPGAAQDAPVVLFGSPSLFGARCPTVNEVADLAGAIPYEIMCGISKRVPRTYA
jgi:alanine racemase